MKRRTLLAGFAGLGLAGCSVDSPLTRIQGSVQALRRKGTYPMSNLQLANMPYASLGVKIGDGDHVVMVLATVDGDALTWTSADRISLVTRHGRLIATRGLSRDLVAVSGVDDEFLTAFPTRPGDPDREFSGSQDLVREKENGVRFELKRSYAGVQPLNGLEGPIPSAVVAEKMVVPGWRWKAENRFWLDHAGQVRKSIQHYCPEIGAIELFPLKLPDPALV